MEEETAGHVLITADHDAEDRPVYRILSLGPEAAPPDAVATREDAEQRGSRRGTTCTGGGARPTRPRVAGPEDDGGAP